MASKIPFVRRLRCHWQLSQKIVELPHGDVGHIPGGLTWRASNTPYSGRNRNYCLRTHYPNNACIRCLSTLWCVSYRSQANRTLSPWLDSHRLGSHLAPILYQAVPLNNSGNPFCHHILYFLMPREQTSPSSLLEHSCQHHACHPTIACGLNPSS